MRLHANHEEQRDDAEGGNRPAERSTAAVVSLVQANANRREGSAKQSVAKTTMGTLPNKPSSKLSSRVVMLVWPQNATQSLESANTDDRNAEELVNRPGP
eukprot:SRR837773.5904.p4 GENE.SRR837773.5904~~SRR837773.5904.p4  ORF type:complete len:100 (-),score=4.76 SRR837773.5904:259-558(-)